ncbi:hypothetical protein EE086_27970 [Klebsiella pneumoniae]|nr:hypothetical protein [Klebsiella pneumoniae]
MFAGKKSAQIREILISESAWEEMTCLFAPSLDYSSSQMDFQADCHSNCKGARLKWVERLRLYNESRVRFLMIFSQYSNGIVPLERI